MNLEIILFLITCIKRSRSQPKTTKSHFELIIAIILPPAFNSNTFFFCVFCFMVSSQIHFEFSTDWEEEEPFFHSASRINLILLEFCFLLMNWGSEIKG